jgi:hypothetical protein
VYGRQLIDYRLRPKLGQAFVVRIRSNGIRVDTDNELEYREAWIG